MLTVSNFILFCELTSFIIAMYASYQLIRMYRICRIKLRWVYNDDNRINQYTWKEMEDLIGILKFPRDKYFPEKDNKC